MARSHIWGLSCGLDAFDNLWLVSFPPKYQTRHERMLASPILSHNLLPSARWRTSLCLSDYSLVSDSCHFLNIHIVNPSRPTSVLNPHHSSLLQPMPSIFQQRGIHKSHLRTRHTETPIEPELACFSAQGRVFCKATTGGMIAETTDIYTT